ncbi:feruloyl esterase [Cladophialophora psammophila CBS 110553]|uniref:Carboxylic ester hydrolase n=1 Tax=Cladophialophora psammophila CBS 110553 TaxID=1182543 RepID=W9X097_9EURO|nr:feruloyl esterase [Cladophialophora psammophila CBS 110553]EXJ70760.1 feruloyl esterase [Cladophialophora psammophila CBS 110553]
MSSSIRQLMVCSPSAIAPPVLLGVEVLSVSAILFTNYSVEVPQIYNFNHPAISVKDVDFCNVTVTYTHPGKNNAIHVETWLPQVWNERLQATGGAGWTAGRNVLSPGLMSGAIGEGYATTSTDAGLSPVWPGDPTLWALVSQGNVNSYVLDTFAYRALEEQALIGKSLVRSFYGRDPVYSYWSGCSQGGRQGLMLAQRFPTLYDGIAASAPAIYYGQLGQSQFIPQLIMNEMKAYPLDCEMDYLTQQAVAHCDANDGVVDGIISDVASCDFDPISKIDSSFLCFSTGANMTVSQTAAVVANASWSGYFNSQWELIWPRWNYGASLTGLGYAPNETNQTVNAQRTPNWFAQLYLERNASFDSATITSEMFDRYWKRFIKIYDDTIGTSDPDLSDFKAAGGKMITWHGMADELIQTKATERYYKEVSNLFPDVQDFYRYFESPGAGHCGYTGVGGQPTTVFDALRAWVENGTAPDVLPVTFNGTTNNVYNRNLCLYPLKQVYKGSGDPTSPDSFDCV